ncbi:MAG: PKD domain-containing protein [Candidatus Bipolaricaulota bacterium]|nr:PKD domain-containing protein [Candidatus Bipolaricaulota bacterium]
MRKETIGLLLIIGILILLGGCGPSEPNVSPTAAFGFVAQNDFRYAPLVVQFDAHASFDNDGTISSYQWDFGNGASGSGVRPVHTYSNPGEYSVTLHVLDDRGGEGVANLTVSVPVVPDDKLLRRYTWQYKGAEKTLERLIPETTYQYYYRQDRQPLVGNYEYNYYVLDSRDDPTIGDIARALRAKIGGGDTEFAKFALSFVQGGITYALDQPGFEYPLYPLETLVDKQGDCEDTTILYVSLLRAQDISSMIAAVDTDDDNMPDHVLALVPVDSSFAAQIDCPTGMHVGLYAIDSDFFAMAETAADPDTSGYIGLGCDPWGIEVTDFKETWDL